MHARKRGAFALTESYMDGDVYAHTYARIDAHTPTRPYTQLHMYVSMQVMTSYTHAFTLHPKTLPHTLLPHTPHSHIYTPLPSETRADKPLRDVGAIGTCRSALAASAASAAWRGAPCTPDRRRGLFLAMAKVGISTFIFMFQVDCWCFSVRINSDT